jgi:glycosyltransferase involved in cell wall biosynthesis
MFVNVDWFFLSHRLPIAAVAADRGIKMTVFTDFTQKHDENYKGFFLRRSPIARAYSNFYSLIIELFKTFVLIKQERPDVIHAVTIKPIIFLGIICFILKIPFIASISGLGPAFTSTSYKGKARLFIIKLIYRIIFSPERVRVICQSYHDAQVLTDNNLVIDKKITMTEGSGVDLEEYKPKKDRASDQINILMASRLLIDKGVEDFCNAAGVVQQKYNFNAKFCLAGPFDALSPRHLSEDQITKFCQSNNVQFLGNRDDLKIILSETDIFVLPSYYGEGIPKVLIEAASSGCAIITTDHPGCRDAVVPEETGILVPPKDSTALENALNCLLSDLNLIKSMGAAGRELAVKRFCIKKVIDIHYSLYFTLSRN